ncbi:OmpH family outer membrane protein [Alkanindiges sp. WGS2144]|uniref:OmpH family outer membrane protein n=1 Tax=Alkanindiges sp. WGS2144 TaxID=3366808 RepID=UPI0037515A6C
MRHLFATAVFSIAALTAGTANANNVAVADSQAAIFNSNYAKQTINSLNTSLKPQRDRIAALQKELAGIENRFKTDAKVLKEDQIRSLQAQAQSKINEYNSTAEGLQKRVDETQATMYKTLLPKLEKIIEDLRKEGNYDIIIEKKNAIWSSPGVDLTDKITQRLNANP